VAAIDDLVRQISSSSQEQASGLATRSTPPSITWTRWCSRTPPWSNRPPPPGHLVLAALALGGFAIGTTEFASMSLLPYFAKDLGVDAPTAGHAISAYALGVVVGAPVIAVLAARLPRRSSWSP
jgi:hypothetical protein